MKNKPWYIWLSLFSLFAFSGISMFQYVPFGKKSDSAWNNWISLCGNLFFIWIILFMLPTVIVTALMEFISSKLPLFSVNGTGGIVIWVCVYGFGVNAVYRLLKWREKH